MSSLERTTRDQQLSEDHTLDLLLLHLGTELYAVPVLNVREIVRYRPYTPVPGAPPTLPGIISQRGAILPVVELRPLLGFTHDDLSASARLVVIHHHEIDMALIAEGVLDLVSLPLSAIGPVPGALDASQAALLRGVAQHAGQPVALLDLDSLVGRLREGE